MKIKQQNNQKHNSITKVVMNVIRFKQKCIHLFMLGVTEWRKKGKEI